MKFFYFKSPVIAEAVAPAGGRPLVDSWIKLNAPEDTHYHKHPLYNTGFALARGDLVCICDSDAVYTPQFIQILIDHFDRHENTVLHLDQVRHVDRCHDPFNFPSIAEILGDGCIKGILKADNLLAVKALIPPGIGDGFRPK